MIDLRVTLSRRWLRDASFPTITLYDLRHAYCYDLRHAYCREALADGPSYADAAKLVGNSPATLARSYDHPVIERLASVADQIAESRLRRLMSGNRST
jgi:hypothetical protein